MSTSDSERKDTSPDDERDLVSIDVIRKKILSEKFILPDGRSSPKAKKHLINDRELLDQVLKVFPDIDIQRDSFAEIKFRVTHEICNKPACPVCNAPVKFRDGKYQQTCSVRCNAIANNKPRLHTNNPAKNKQSVEKRSNTRKRQFLESHKELADRDWLFHQHVIQKKSIVEISKQLNVTPATVSKYLKFHKIEIQEKQILREATNLRRCGKRNVQSVEMFRKKALNTLSQRKKAGELSTSTGEQELKDFVAELVGDDNCVFNSFDVIFPKEIDIFVPSKNIALEYCGLFWHSEEQGRGKWYHYDKWKACNDKGIQLITIFEDEWRERNQQVRAKIKSLFGLDDREKIYARNCKVITITTAEKKTFLEHNHIQGDGPGKFKLALEYRGEIVAVLVLNKVSNQYYLTRFATSRRVIGGFSKLFAQFLKNKNDEFPVITFADLRWSNGNLYLKTGWKLDTILRPDYYYVRNNKRYHKFQFRRKFLGKKLQHFNPELSERENCKRDGLLRIWDCGKMRFVKPR